MSFAKPQMSHASPRTRLRDRFGARVESRRLPASGRLLRHGALEVRWSPIEQWRGDPSAWHDLIKRAVEPNVFLEPGFALAAAEHLGAADVGTLSVYAGSRLVGLLPGRVEGLARGRPVPVFVAWTHPFAPLSLPLLDRDAAGKAVPALLAAMRALPGAPKAALFPLLPDLSVAARLIGLEVAAQGRAVTRLNIHGRAALLRESEDALGMVSAGRRKELGRLRRRLAAAGYLAEEVLSDVRDVRMAVTDFIELEQRGWKGRAGTAISQNPAAAQFMTEALVALAAERKVRIDRLRFDDRTIAAAVTLYSGSDAWFWKIVYDEEFARYSPGVQLTLDLTDALEGDWHLSQVDSCAVANHPMIDHLWAGRLNMADWLVPLDGGVGFALAAGAERARRAVLAPLKALRDRIRG